MYAQLNILVYNGDYGLQRMIHSSEEEILVFSLHWYFEQWKTGDEKNGDHFRRSVIGGIIKALHPTFSMYFNTYLSIT